LKPLSRKALLAAVLQVKSWRQIGELLVIKVLGVIWPFQLWHKGGFGCMKR